MPPASPHLPPPSRPHPESLTIGALLTVLVALGQITISLYVPSMPSLVAELGTSAERVSLTLSLFLAGFAVAQLVYGPLSDRFGRRPVLLCGIVLYLVASLICALATTIEALIAARVVQGMGACVGPVLGRAIVRDVYGRERAAQVLAYIGLAFAVSPAVTPIIGGYLQVWFGWRANFFLLSAVGALVLWAVWLLLDETNRRTDPDALHPRAMARNYLHMLSTPEYVGYMLSLGCVFAGLVAYIAVAPFVFIDTIGLTPDVFGLVNIFNVVGFFIGTLAAGRLTPSVGLARMVGVGIVLCLLGGDGAGRAGERRRHRPAVDGVHDRHGHCLSQRLGRGYGAVPAGDGGRFGAPRLFPDGPRRRRQRRGRLAAPRDAPVHGTDHHRRGGGGAGRVHRTRRMAPVGRLRERL